MPERLRDRATRQDGGDGQGMLNCARKHKGILQLSAAAIRLSARLLVSLFLQSIRVVYRRPVISRTQYG